MMASFQQVEPMQIEDALGRRSSGNAAVTIDLLSFLER